MESAPAERNRRPSVQPSALGQLLRDRSLRFGAVLAIAVAIPVAVLFYFEFRSLRDLGQSSTVVLRQLSRETADGVTATVEDRLKSPYINVLLRISQQQAEPLDLPFIQNTFDQSLDKDPYVTGYFVWSDVGTVRRGEVLAYGADRTFRGAGADGDRLLARVREIAAGRWPLAALQLPMGGRPTYVQAQLRYETPARTRLTSFVAIGVNAESFRREYMPRIVAAKLKGVAEPIGFPPLAVTISDSAGQVVFPPSARAPKTWVDERSFPLVFFDRDFAAFVGPPGFTPDVWHIRIGYGDRSIAQIVDDRTRPQRGMMTLLAAVMALGVFVVAQAASREVRLAELKSNFVASVSHDLKTPLALIQLFAETLELGRVKSTDRAQEYYRIINSEARKLTRLINNLLDFSRIEAGLRHYELQPADLGALTTKVVGSLGSQFRQNGFTVTTRVAPAGVRAQVDPEAAQQAIENLLSNAMKYSPEARDILVEVDTSGCWGRVRVTDHGIGIAPAVQRRIFRKFYRVASDAGTGPQGCGLGLAIVDHVMRGHGGSVRVESEVGRGSTFTLCFPLDTEAHGYETDTGDRGRASDVARSA